MIRVPSPTAAVFFVAGVAVLFVWGGAALQLWLGEGGLLAAEWFLLFAPAVLFVHLGRYDPSATFAVARPSWRAVVAAILLIVGATPIAWTIGWIQSLVLSAPTAVVEVLRALVTAEDLGRLAWLLMVLAVTPAVCEEAVFRGLLLSSTRTLAPWRAVLLNGLVFGGFHISFEAPVRFLPTAWLGIVMAWAVLRARSVWIGVLMHLLNNGTIVLLASVPALSRLVIDPDAPPPMGLVFAAALSLGVGVAVMRGEPPREGSAEGTFSRDEAL